MACIGMRLDVFPSIIVISLIPRLSALGGQGERGKGSYRDTLFLPAHQEPGNEANDTKSSKTHVY